ncbi:FadR/GntR family transcriptional regulator [Oceanobacillus luteolus]|uniref:FadR/GntR family transcriptional regulator n=1 Tax=Oceanobacillus luteolus TaxID=1274358 RepID=A0ABW4HPA1_9BACI
MNPLYIEVVASIKDKINEGVLEEGEKLPSERELSIEYNVSRNVIREAISVLRDEGLVTVYAGKGSYITKPDPTMITETIKRVMSNYNTTLENILEVREGLELSIIKNVIKRASPDDIRKLNEIYESMDENKMNITRFVKLDERFHLSLAESSKNPLYVVLLQTFIEMTQHVFFEFTKLIPESVEQAQEHHLKLVLAIEERNEALALDIMNAHMQVLRDEIEILKGRGVI